MNEKIIDLCIYDGLSDLKKYVYYKNFNLLKAFYNDWHVELKQKFERINYLKKRWKQYDQ